MRLIPCERCNGSGSEPADLARRDLRDLAAAQRRTADDLRDAAIRAHDAGATWTQIARDLGMCRETAYRQIVAGSPVVVLRPTHNGRTGNHAHAPGPAVPATVPRREDSASA